jgi:hypothetical protein
MSDHAHSINTYTNAHHNHTLLSPPPMLYGKPLVIDQDCPPGKLYSLGGQIYGHPSTMQDVVYGLQRGQVGPAEISKLMNHQPTPKEPEMSTIDKIKQERKEKREREKLEAKFEAWDAAIGSAADGDVYGFSWTPSEKTYRYAALFTCEHWYLTGSHTGGLATEDFIAWLIEKDVDVQDMVFMEPLT